MLNSNYFLSLQPTQAQFEKLFSSCSSCLLSFVFFSFRKTFYTCRRSRILLSHCFSHIINGHSQYFQAAVAGLQTAENAATLTRSQKGNAVSCPRWSCLRQTFLIVTPATRFLRLFYARVSTPYAQRYKFFDSLHWKRKNSPTCSNYHKIVQDVQLIYITNNS